jgi:hypothetical protein
MGVLLCVMLIGKFPFEGDSISTMGVHDPLKKVWVQQNRTTWSHNTLLKDQLPYLSPEVRAWCTCHLNTDAWLRERVTNRGMNDCGPCIQQACLLTACGSRPNAKLVVCACTGGLSS